MQSFSRRLSALGVRCVLNKGTLPRPRFTCLHPTRCTPASQLQSLCFSSAAVQPEGSMKRDDPRDLPTTQKRKNARSPAGKTSLRRVAVEAQRSRESAEPPGQISSNGQNVNRVTAVSIADQFDMDAVARILQSHGFTLDPDGTGFELDQVLHTRGVNNGDIFIFPSGTLVAWSLPEEVVSDLATKTLLPAATRPHIDQMEMEDLEYVEDSTRESSGIKGEVISLGTKLSSSGHLGRKPIPSVDTTLAKIAFSSGLARSTKLAVLEGVLAKYFDSTREIPSLMARGSRLPLSRRFMLRKTGELLELRAQLNHYSELTDSLPDLFWDSKPEIEGFYDQIGRVLDVGVRIKALNEKMDYAQEIASILRQTMSEKHSINLEWIIILLIAVEVGFELRREWKERREPLGKETEA